MKIFTGRVLILSDKDVLDSTNGSKRELPIRNQKFKSDLVLHINSKNQINIIKYRKELVREVN